MVKMTPAKMAGHLSIRNHRERFLVARWIEANIRSGKAAPDFGEGWAAEVVDEVRVRAVKEDIDYEVVGGILTSVVTGYRATKFFATPGEPTKEEIELLEVCDPQHFKWLEYLCIEIAWAFDHPHSCAIDYHIREEECCSCGNKKQAVNYHDGKRWLNFCGGSPRCCP